MGIIDSILHGFIEGFVKKDIENARDPYELERKYMEVESKDTLYSFQKKYSNQEAKLLNVFGSVNNEQLKNRLRIIIITDTHGSLDEERLDKIV